MPLPPVIGRYRTRRLLGTGTFATVVLAEDEALETSVAVKLLAENWSLDPDVRARFVREARILRRIESDRLIRVHDIGEFEQRPYFVMDFAPGGALGDRLRTLRDRGIPVGHGAVLRLAAELAGCVGAAHSFGLVHRDVKPSNLLVRRSRGFDAAGDPVDDMELLAPSEALVLADFGLARDLAAGSALSVGAGTASYMAPEQADPSMGVDERTDLYACTVTLAAALTATPAASIADPGRRATALAALDLPVAKMIEQGLAADREARPASADEWLSAVDTAVRGAPRGTARLDPDPAPRRPGLPRWLAALRRSRMIGRGPARDHFRAAWERASSGERAAVLYSGEAGVGKSRLLAELAAEVAGEGAVVLAGRCDEGASLAYGALVHALRPRLYRRELDDLLAQIGPHAGYLTLMFPELATRMEGPPADSHPDSSRGLLLHAVEELVAVLAGGAPIVLVVDDLHEADPSSLTALRYLVRSDRQEPFVLLASYRSTEVAADHPLLAFYEDLHRHHLVTRTELSGLAASELTELVAQHTNEPASPEGLEALGRQTGGNPFFVEEVLSSLADQALDLGSVVEHVPAGARDVVRSRVRRLPDAAQRALVTAAVAGPSFDRQVVERVEPVCVAGLDVAIAGGFIEPSDDRLVFRHGLVRSALLHDLDRRDEASLHWRVGATLERIYAADIDEHVAEIAHHLRLGVTAGSAAKASAYLERAGEQQFRAVALDEAVTSLSAALEFMDDDTPDAILRRVRILELLAEAHFWRADPDHMRSAALAAAELARAHGSAADLARTAVVAARWNRGGELEQNVLALLDEAGARLPPGDNGLRSQVLAMRAYMLQGAARGFDTRGLADEAEAMARRCDDVDALTMALLVRTYTEAGAPTVATTRRVVAQLEEAAARMARPDHRQQYAVFALRARAQVQLAAGDRAGFTVTHAEFGEMAERMRAPYWRSQSLQWDTAVALAEGRFAAAVESAEAALATWDARPDAFRVFLVQMAVAGLERGEHETVLPEIGRLVARDTSSVGYAWRAALAAGMAAVGPTDEARRRLEDLATDGFCRLADDHQKPQALRWLAECVAYLRDPDIAHPLAMLVEPYTGLLLTGPAVTAVEGAADRAIAQVLAVLGQHDDADRHFERAVELEARLGFAALVARTRRWWAQSLLERASPDAHGARALALAAAESAERLGMQRLAAEARALSADAERCSGQRAEQS